MAFTKKSSKELPFTPIHTPRGWRHRYDVLTQQAPMNEWQLELACWAKRVDTGMGAYYHLRRAAELLLPQSEWHPWREERFKALCDEELVYRLGNSSGKDSGVRIRNLSFVGCGASGKTSDAATFGYLFWLSDPMHSYVILTSTSKTKMRQRAWPVIQECHNAARNVMDLDGTIGPHMLNSTMELQAVKGDSKHAVFGQAIEMGELDKAVQNLRGVHAPRICLIIDEADGTPDAIYATIPNMLKGCREFVLINSANGPMTHLDTFSRVCTPRRGWGSINVDTERWETAPVPEFQLPGGTCLHFDGRRSPNVIAGRTLYPYLYTYENWLHVADKPDVQNTVTFWSQERGFWPPEGFSNTVFNEALVEAHGGREREVTWLDRPEACAALDPAFGGDDCVLQLGLVGDAVGRKHVLLLTDTLLVPFNPTSSQSIDAQIAAWVVAKCRERGVRPELFGLDATGTGRGVAAILNDTWSPLIVKVEFGGAASEEAASGDDARPARDVFANQVTALWWRMREMLVAEQLKGLGAEAVKQACSRLYEYVSRRYRVESKVDMKGRIGRSPDQFDAVTVLGEVVRRNGRLLVGAIRGGRPRNQAWLEVQREVTQLEGVSAGYKELPEFSSYIDV